MTIDQKYQWLENEKAPAMLVEALTYNGLKEVIGTNDNPTILSWAKTLGISWYSKDSIPWCGLFVGWVAHKCNYAFDKNKLLSAREWINWGNPVVKGNEMLWDVLVFVREGGGHVGFYVAEDATSFCVYGGNQSDSVGFTWIAKSRLLGARRPKYVIGEPDNVRQISMNRDGMLSTNEA